MFIKKSAIPCFKIIIARYVILVYIVFSCTNDLVFILGCHDLCILYLFCFVDCLFCLLRFPVVFFPSLLVCFPPHWLLWLPCPALCSLQDCLGFLMNNLSNVYLFLFIIPVPEILVNVWPNVWPIVCLNLVGCGTTVFFGTLLKIKELLSGLCTFASYLCGSSK